MPLLFKILGYGGNGLLLLFAIIGVLDRPGMALIFGGLAGVNLYLIHRLDRLSGEEATLATAIRMARMRQELAAIYRGAAEDRDQDEPEPPLRIGGPDRP